MSDPKVQAALQEVAKSPWKVVKYLMDKDVMAVVSAMKDALQQERSSSKPPTSN